MKIRTVTLALACAALLGGCATKDYVNEQIASVNKRIDSQQADTSGKLSQTASLYEGSKTASTASKPRSKASRAPRRKRSTAPPQRANWPKASSFTKPS